MRLCVVRFTRFRLSRSGGPFFLSIFLLPFFVKGFSGVVQCDWILWMFCMVRSDLHIDAAFISNFLYSLESLLVRIPQ